MNIFATSSDPVESAKALDDRRLIKMILETAQLLSGALRSHGFNSDELYKLTHANHPCSIWTRKSVGNFNWLVKHGFALAEEYYFRFNKQHKSKAVINIAANHITSIPSGELTPFANCAQNNSLGLSYIHLPVHEAYRAYLSNKWVLDGSKARWTSTQPPKWKVIKYGKAA